jgi:hypothetical protein
MRPNRPRTELKISMTRILTNLSARKSDVSIQWCQKGPLQRGIGCIGEGRATAIDTDSNTADQVAHAHGYASPEQGETGVVCISGEHFRALDRVDLGGEDDGHDDSVDGDDLAEDDGDEILRSDAWCLYTTAENGRSRDKNTPTR